MRLRRVEGFVPCSSPTVPGIGTVGYAAEYVGSSAESTGAIDASVLALGFVSRSGPGTRYGYTTYFAPSA